ncbi:hypothetical protein EVAR_65148_1 [Eumeta japonica]|uniref:Uncharacterized protein n=1 Tax=Eumeta variegata TaxID=151549 RepID=A0A4C2A850_EUMVA|nr:hypothetical protein EVAR_65148_1 [Eumeta japonica]
MEERQNFHLVNIMRLHYIWQLLESLPAPFGDALMGIRFTWTPDIRSDESDSSAGSALCRSTAEATQALADEWECIERRIYDEDGKKVTRPQLVEECQQWRQLHPHLR